MAEDKKDSIIQSIHFPKELVEKMAKYEKKYFLTKSALVRRAIVEFIEREETKERRERKEAF